MEPVIDEQLIEWLARVNKTWISKPGASRPFDIGKRIQFLTVDIITRICLGSPLGCVASDSDKHDFLATVERGNAVCQHFSVLLELNSLMYYLTKIPLLGPLIVPKSSDKKGVGKIMGVSSSRSMDRPMLTLSLACQQSLEATPRGWYQQWERHAKHLFGKGGSNTPDRCRVGNRPVSH